MDDEWIVQPPPLLMALPLRYNTSHRTPASLLQQLEIGLMSLDVRVECRFCRIIRLWLAHKLPVRQGRGHGPLNLICVSRGDWGSDSSSDGWVISEGAVANP